MTTLIKPAMFVKIKGCSIYFEVSEVFSDMVVCASRNPKDITELVFIDNIELCVSNPPNNNWIKLNREKGFYDKFYPEGWQGSVSKVIHFNDLKEGYKICTLKGVCELIKKRGNKWITKGCQKTLQGEYFWHIISVESKILK